MSATHTSASAAAQAAAFASSSSRRTHTGKASQDQGSLLSTQQPLHAQSPSGAVLSAARASSATSGTGVGRVKWSMPLEAADDAAT